MPARATLSRFIISIIIAATSIVAVFVIFRLNSGVKAPRPTDPLSALNSRNFPAERARFKKSIKEVGTESAYNLFKKETTGKEFGVAHTLSHIMGELVYEKEGLQGVVFCDAAFAFGCYHSFFGRAIADHGQGSVRELYLACINRFGEDSVGCLHGLGHGVLGYLGDDNLIEALDVCDKLAWSGPRGGCKGGVFMEFNFHTMQSLIEGELRKFNPDNPNEPCNRIPRQYRSACYLEQPQWWLRVHSKDYAKVGRLCKEVTDDEERESCFKGIGHVASPDAEYDPSAAAALCALMPDRSSAVICTKGSAWMILVEPSSRNKAPKTCDGLSESEREGCPTESDVSGNRYRD